MATALILWLLAGVALADDVVVRQDTPLTDVQVIEAEGRHSGAMLGVGTIVLPALPGQTDDLWVLGSGLSTLSDEALRWSVRGAEIADWVAAGGYATVTSTSPQQAALYDDGEEIDRFFVEPLWTVPAGAATGSTAQVPCTACGANAFCLATGTTNGTCTCKPGFSGPECEDIDECPDGCGPRSVCTNLVGTFSCDCEGGFAWDGGVCANVDECALGTDDCDPLAACADTDGGFACACPEGYEGDGTQCTNVDECSLGTDTCDPDAICADTDGAFSCACPEGFDGDGSTCTPIPDPCDEDPCAEGEACSSDGAVVFCDCIAGWAPQSVGCAPICGDDMVALGAETCDDGDQTPGDGCSATCAVEDGWVCNGGGCLRDTDGDGVPDDEDVCPFDADPDQADTDGDGVGDLCDADDTDPQVDDTGSRDTATPDPSGCGCNQSGGAGWLLVLPLLWIRRRSRTS